MSSRKHNFRTKSKYDPKAQYIDYKSHRKIPRILVNAVNK